VQEIHNLRIVEFLILRRPALKLYLSRCGHAGAPRLWRELGFDAEAPRRKVDKPLDKSSSRTPTAGAEVKRGDARADTGAAPIPFGGLSTGGGGAGGVQINVGDFCCPEYIAAMNQRITENWNKNQGAAGITVMKFVIQRDGTITGVETDQPSRNPVLDLESRRALVTTRQLPPLPAAFTRPTLTVFLSFEYKR